MTDDFSNAERLTVEHVKAIHELQQKKEIWETLKKEYQDLKKKLESFPLKMRHEYKVPIGSVGFFEGQLIHTNEIMVLLGDNWFTQCSAHHASQIVDHRVEVVEKNLKEVCDEMKFLESRKEAIQNLSTMDKVEGIVDIREEKKADNKQDTGKRHIAHKSTHNIKPRSLKDLDREKMENKSKEKIQKPNKEDMLVVDKLFARLDELENEEEIIAMKEHEQIMNELKPEKTNHVRFQDNKRDDEIVMNGSINEAESSIHEAGSSEENCIRFKHTESNSEKTDQKDSSFMEKTMMNGNDQKFTSPADIYAQFIKPQTTEVDEKPLKSILKKERKHSSEGLKPKPILKHSPEHKSDGSSGDELNNTQTSDEPKPILKSGSEAVCPAVIERSSHASTVETNRELPKKKVSRFKAARMKK